MLVQKECVDKLLIQYLERKLNCKKRGKSNNYKKKWMLFGFRKNIGKWAMAIMKV